MSQVSLEPSEWVAEFVERLLACPSLETAAGRRSVISMLPPDLGHSITDQNETNNRVAVTALAWACLRYEGGVGVLLERVRFFDTGISGLQALETFLAGQPVPPPDAFPEPPPSASAVINNTGGVNLSNSEVKGDINLTDNRNQTINNFLPPTPPKPRSPLVPPDPPLKFAGRVRELAELAEALRSGEGGRIALSALRGQGGIGKTTLARQLAYNLWTPGPNKLFEAVLWTEVKPNPDPWTHLRRWAGHCGVELDEGRAGRDERQAYWDEVAETVRAELGGMIAGRTLVVFDDVWADGIEAVRRLLKAVPLGASVLTTSRDTGVGVALAARSVEVGTLPTPEAVALLVAYLDDKGLPQAGLEELAKGLKGHALALTLAAKRLNLEEGQVRAALPRHLEQYRKGLPAGSAVGRLQINGQPTSREDSLTLALAYSYEGLTTDQKARFRQLGALTYDQPFDLRLLAGLWDVAEPAEADEEAEPADETAREWANELRRLSLVERTTETELVGGWYRQHPILHAYALALLKADPTEWAAARDRYHDRSIEIAQKFRELQDKPEEWGVLDRYLPHIHGAGDALAALTLTDLPAPDEPTLRRALNFASNITGYLYRRQEVHKLEWLAMGLRAARALAERKREGLLLHELGVFHKVRGEGAKALEYYEQSLSIKKELNDPRGEATTLSAMGGVYSDLGDKKRALELFEQALPLRRLVGDRGGQAATLSAMGKVYSYLGDKGRALELYEQALPLRRQVGDRGGEATTLNNMGGVYSALGDKERALELYEQALPLRHQVGDRDGEAYTLHNMAMTLWEMEERERALQLEEQSLILFEGVRSPRAVDAARNVAQMRAALGQDERPRYWARRYRLRRG